MQILRVFILSCFLFLIFSCEGNLPAQTSVSELTEKNVKDNEKTIKVGAESIEEIKKIIGEKAIGIIANQSSTVGASHLVDTLLAEGINVKKIFSPEHGFRGDADAGEKVASNKDPKTNLPIYSLYGNNKKPSKEDVSGLEVLIFDLQDVGVRFYTYISTLHYVMEAAAEEGIAVIVLDRPNPNGNYVDGPIRQQKFKSFVGMHPIPIVHGMTIGEIAKMINGENWLKGEIQCDLTVIPCQNYNHSMSYSLPIAPSPNLRSDEAILLYPSLCLFEGTALSVGRGTETPFEIFGHPALKDVEEFNYEFTPVSSYGAKQPVLENQKCYGLNLHDFYNNNRPDKLEIKWLIESYHAFKEKNSFFNKNNFFDLLAGTDELRKQIIQGKTEQEIRQTWEDGLNKFKKVREKYLIYSE